MPTMSNGYSSFYGGDIHVIPTSTSRYDSSAAPSPHHHHRHNSGTSDWRGPNVSVPVTTTTYTVRKDPVTSSSSVRAHSRHRSSTIDATSKRPPIIVTTRQTREPSSSTTPSSSRDIVASPAPDRGRGSYRTNDDAAQYYTQPASSIRSRSSTRAYPSGTMSSTMDNEEFLRLRQRTDDRLAPSWNDQLHRRERPSSFYAEPSRHSTTTVDLGDSGYEYTTPSALARYDLDNDRRHRDSTDRSNTYYRPSVNVPDVSRPYDPPRRGPPPTTRGLDKVNRRVVEATPATTYDRPSSRVPGPAAVVAVPVPDRRSSVQLDVPPSPIERRPSRTGHRPVSLYQDGPPRASIVEDSYRARDDDYVPRDPRDKEYHRDDVVSRGFGLRTEGDKEPRDRRESRREPRLDDRDRDHRESKRPVDDDADRYDKRYSRDPGRKEEDPRAEKKSGKEDSFRDKVATSLSLAAGAIGLGGAALAHRDKDDKEDKGSPRRRADEREEADERPKASRREHEDRPRDDGNGERSKKDREADDTEDKERNRRDAEAKLTGEPVSKDGNSSSDESKPRRRRRPSNTFKPNDTAGLLALKEQLKAKEESEKENTKAASKDPSPDRRSQPSPSQADRAEDPARSSKEELRGRGAASPASDEKQVRVVSPPRDKDEKKPIKGILKQPKTQFPEEPNPVREGVAPHKDDKTKGNVPPGARWTKINRKLVNPEALTIGKERFEVRDDFVIVLRVLSKEEIEAYTAATAQLRSGLLPFPFSLLSFPPPVHRRAAHNVTSSIDSSVPSLPRPRAQPLSLPCVPLVTRVPVPCACARRLTLFLTTLLLLFLECSLRSAVAECCRKRKWLTTLAEMRSEQERGRDDRDDDQDDEDQDERRRPHRSHRRDPRDEEDDEKRRRDDKREREKERDTRSRRHRYEDDEEPRRDEPRRLEYNPDDERDRLPTRSHRHREREREREPVSVRRDD